METLTQGFDRNATSVLDAVAASIVEMRATAERMAAVATENTNKASAVASGARETSSNVQTVATATEELSASVSEISRQVTQSASIAAKAVQEAQETNAEIQGLAAMAQRIGDIVKLINNIASQTNLLALNATIEAARAGDERQGLCRRRVGGKEPGRADVKGHRRNRLPRSPPRSRAPRRKSVGWIEAIGKTIGEISEIATTIATAIEQQGAATQEIARNVQQAAAGTQEVSANVGGVTEAATATGIAANQDEAAASESSRQSQQLREQVNVSSSVRCAQRSPAWPHPRYRSHQRHHARRERGLAQRGLRLEQLRDFRGQPVHLGILQRRAWSRPYRIAGAARGRRAERRAWRGRRNR